MALVFPFCYRCFICCLLCLLVVGQDANNYQNEQYGRVNRQRLQEQSQQQRNAKTRSSPSPSSSAAAAVSTADETKRTVVDPDRRSIPDRNRDKTGPYFSQKINAERKLGPDNNNNNNNAGNVDDIYTTNKRQAATESVNKSPPTAPENADDRNGFKKRKDYQRKTLKENGEAVANLSNKLNPDGSEGILPSKEEYLQRYYGMNRKGRQNLKQDRKEEKAREDIIADSASFKPISGSPASLSNKDEGESENSDNATDDILIKNNGRNNLYVYDQHAEDEVFDQVEDEENDDMDYVEYVSKYTDGRVKRHVARGRDDWVYEDDRNVDYEGLDYRERNKDRHGSRRSRNRRGKGRGSSPNGHDRSSSEMDPNLDPENYDQPDHAHYHVPRSPRRRTSGKGGGKRSEGSDGGGGGGGRGSSRDRRYGSRHSDYDTSERGYSDPDDGYTDKRTPSSPSLSPSRHPDSYTRYSEDSARSRMSKSSSQKTCQICTMKKMDREMRLRTLKAQIIKQIGFNELPNITKNDRILPKVPTLKHIIENMTMQRDEPSWRDSSDDKADDISEQMIITAEKPSHLLGHFDYNLNGLCYFNVSGKLETSIIKEASLWIYLRPHSKIRQSRVEVRIWNANDMVGHSEPLKTLKVEIGRFGEWTHFKATSIIKQWVKNTKLNYGLNITAMDSYGNSRIWTPNIPDHGEEYPVMDIKFSPRRHSRHRRTVSQICTDEEQTGRCCLYPLMVDFLEMKWYWVIYPHHFEANYCSGNCSLEIVDDTLPYAYIGFKSAKTLDGVRCCTSTREGELQILYYTDSNKIIHTYLEDIVVKECGCR